MALDDKLDAILVHVGKTQEGIVNIKEDIKDLKGDIKEVNETITDLTVTTVKAPECTGRHKIVADSIDNLRTEIRSVLRTAPLGRSPSSDRYPSIGGTSAAQAILAAGPAGPAGTVIEKIVDNKLEENKEKSRRSVTFWLGTIAAVVGLLGGGSLIQAIRCMSALNTSITLQSEEATKAASELKRELKKLQAVPTAGPTSDPVSDKK